MLVTSLFLLLAACSPNGYNSFDDVPLKYEELPEEGPVELNVPPEAVLQEQNPVNLAEGEWQRFTFEKSAGKVYILGLDQLSGDLDLYAHWVPDVSLSNFQFSSWNWDLEDEQIDLHATQDGEYYVGVYGYEAAQGVFSLYSHEPTDEVGWPVDWAADGESEADLVQAGLGWLEGHSYGAGCYAYHPGLDMNHGSSGGDDYGDPVYAVADGVVVGSGSYGSSWGQVVMVEHSLSNGVHFWSQYAHLSERDVASGETVLRGQRIGAIGDGEGRWGAHLHFEVRRSGEIGTSPGYFPCDLSAQSVDYLYDDPRTFIEQN